jgi:glycosyltransferase involved in cell wall biosynthesis
MNLLLLNDSYFGSTLEEAEINVLRVGPGEDNDIVVDPGTDDISEIIAKLSFHPDVILQVDSINRRIFFNGLDKIEAPRAFYAIDGPINDFWQRDFANYFDLIWTDQSDTLDSWHKDGITWANWLPLAADRSIFFPPNEGEERDLDIVFVGTMDFAHRPKRSAILHRLRQIANVTLVDGGGTRSVPPVEVASYYRRAKIVLNELLFDGVNLRTFEAMSCGAVLLTEQGRGEDRLFEDGKELLTFNTNNLEKVVLDILEDSAKRLQISNSAADATRSSHSIQHRARKVLRELSSLKRRPERDHEQQKVLADWSIWMASWKWEHLKLLRHEMAERLVDRFHLLDPARQTIFLEGVGQAEQARDFLKQMLDSGVASPSLKPALASLSLSIGDEKTAAEALDLDSADRMSFHLCIGERLFALGQDLTPGFTRLHAPRSSWHAFEHFQLAYSFDENCRAAIEGMDKVLMKHHSPEFILPVWQKFHSRNPKHDDVERLLIKRAKSGYFIPGQTKGAKTDPRPFSNSWNNSSRMQARPRPRRAMG